MRCFIAGIAAGLACLVMTLPALAAAPSLADIQAFAAAEVKIERLRKQSTPDWDAIAGQYEITAPIVKYVDSQMNTAYDAEIRGALDRCAAGETPRVHQQTLAKGLQHVAVLMIKRELSGMGGSSDAAERVAAFFEGIRPTFARRDSDFFKSSPRLEPAADAAIAELKRGGSLMARREFMDAINRTYGLCVLYEIQGVEKYRANNRPKCAVKLQEAVVFYRVVEPEIKRNSPDSHDIIKAMLAADYESMDAALLERELNKGLAGITLR